MGGLAKAAELGSWRPFLRRWAQRRISFRRRRTNSDAPWCPAAAVWGAFAVLMSGDRDKHDGIIVEQAIDLAETVDMIVLAQASMNRLAGVLQEKTGRTVLSSPRLGVDYLAQRVAELPV